jgi:hypothetical protein
MDVTGNNELFVGSRDGNHLSVTPVRRAHPDSTEFWDGNWLIAHVEVRAGAFQGAFEADLRADEFQDFAEKLQALQGASEGAAVFESVEGWVILRLVLDQRGVLEGSCEVRDDPALGASLRFGLTVSQVRRLDVLDELGEILRTFPVVGDPEAESKLLLGPIDDLDEA